MVYYQRLVQTRVEFFIKVKKFPSERDGLKKDTQIGNMIYISREFVFSNMRVTV